MTAYVEHYAVHWDVNKNPPPAFQADDGVPHNEALYKTFNPLIQRGKECRETKNPQAFSRLRILEMIGYSDYEQMIWVRAPVQRRKIIVMP